MKQRLFNEMCEYWANFIYLALVFAIIVTERRLILGAHGISTMDYGFALARAAILAKVIMVGDLMRLGRSFDHKPLIYGTVYKTVLFTLLVVLFKLIESAATALWRGGTAAAGIQHLFRANPGELAANWLIVFATFIPFFAMRETRRAVGEGKLRVLFFGSRAPDKS